MGPPSSLFLAILAIVILGFAILSFISAVNYKNVSNNKTEGESIDKDTASSLSTVMIIFGIIMVIVFIWLVYVIFVYDDKDKSGIDKRNVDLLVKANQSISKYNNLSESFKKLQIEKSKIKDNLTNKNKKYEKWDYCPSPKIKINIKEDTGEVLNVVYNKSGNIEGFIVKPKKKSGGKDCEEYQTVKLEMETQPCYELNENDKKKNQGILSQTLGPMTQTMVFKNPFQNTNKPSSSNCDAENFLSRKKVDVPVVSLSKKCNNNISSSDAELMKKYGLVTSNDFKPQLNPFG